MALLTTQTIDRATGVIPSYGAVAASDTFTPGDRTFLHIKNGGGSSDTVTVAITGAGAIPGITYRAGAGTGGTYAVAAGAEKIIGPFPASFFADSVTGLATVTHSFTTSVTVAVFSLAV